MTFCSAIIPINYTLQSVQNCGYEKVLSQAFVHLLKYNGHKIFSLTEDDFTPLCLRSHSAYQPVALHPHQKAILWRSDFSAVIAEFFYERKWRNRVRRP